MKLIIAFCALIFVHTIYTEEKVDPSVDDEEEMVITSKKSVFVKPNIPDNYFLLYFKSPTDLDELLVLSEATKDGVEEGIAKYNGVWSVEVPQSSAVEDDYALVLKSKARHAAISAKLNRPFHFTTDQLVVQYDVKFQNGQECGGAYIKLLSHSDDLDLRQFYDKTQYTIMFGPDRCGNDNKLHFIFQHKHPKTGKYEEKHAKKPVSDIEKYFTDKKTHLFTLVLNSDNTFQVYVDQDLVNSGSLLTDFEPAVNTPKEVDDPSDKKPSDWDDNPSIIDSTATKPDDWDEDAVEFIENKNAKIPDGWLEDEPTTVADENAEKPKDWDDDMDGEWEAPRIDNPICKSAPGCGPWTAPKIKNPEYKGKWSAPMIDNPNYKGQWKPRRIANPDYFEDEMPYRMTPIGAVGLELWSMSDEIAFDNLLIVDNKKAADDFAKETWLRKKEAEKMADPNSQSVVDAVREATSERPWIWLVVVAVIGLPIVLIVVYCCRSSTSDSESSSSARRRQMQHKKDDDQVAPEDDDDDEQKDVAVPAQSESNARGDVHPAGTTKASLESEEEHNSSDHNDNNNNDPDPHGAKKRSAKTKT